MYQLVFGGNFREVYRKVCGRDRRLKLKVVKALKLLAADPKHRGLKAHKVGTKNFGEKWAVWVTGDLRVIWDYGREAGKILVLSLGGHSGKGKVYR